MEMMANKAMLPRHWKRIEGVTKCELDVYADGFLLKNLMEAPLLQYKEDVEVRALRIYSLSINFTCPLPLLEGLRVIYIHLSATFSLESRVFKMSPVEWLLESPLTAPF